MPLRAFTVWPRLLACCLALLVVSSARAQTPSQPIFGPVSFKLPNSQTFDFSRTFSPTPSTTGPHLLRVNLSPPNSLKSLSVTLNNTQILSLANFAGGVTQVDRSIVIQANNTLTGSIRGAPGTVVTVTVFATPKLPQPTALTPNPLSLSLGTNGTLNATLSPSPTATGSLGLTSSNTAVATVPASISFAAGQTSVPIPVTSQGTGTAVMTASANGASASATVNVTNAAPLIFGQSPKDVTLPGGSLPQISAQYSSAGSSIDPNSVRLRLNNQDVTADSTVVASAAFYQVTQPLPVGVHSVSLTVANVGGLSTTRSWSFTIDDPAPNFHSESPRNVFLADRQPRIRVLLSGFNIALSSVRITLDGTDVTALAQVATDRIVFDPPTPLSDGTHTVNVTATDGRGMSGGKQWGFTVELPPPPTTADGVRTPRTVTPELTVLP